MIKSVAAIIQRVVRDQGTAFRYGGEEFLVLLNGMDEEAASRVATDIYNGVREMALRFAGTDIGHVDVSIGVASYPEHVQSDNLLRAADVALYRAKELGGRELSALACWRPDDRHCAGPPLSSTVIKCKQKVKRAYASRFSPTAQLCRAG